MKKSLYLVVMGMMIVLLAAAGCQKKTTKGVEPEPAPPAEKPEVTQPSKQVDEESAQQMQESTEPAIPLQFQTVYFEFDKYAIPADQRSNLAKNAEVLKAHPDAKILIEGHCDERGTIEYNLSLGEKRANTIKQYLVNYGISPSRLSTISYGEEKPADPDHNEKAWARNRRAEFTITQR